MAYNVEIADTDFTFDVEAGETVLDAAERQGLALPYSCRKGVCNTCMGRIVEGHAGLRGKGDVSGPADNVMFCQARPQSDLTITPASVEKIDPVRRKTVSARIRRKRQIAPDVVQLSLRFPIGTRVPFYCTASGKMYLSSLTAAHLRTYINATDLEARTSNTITDPREDSLAVDA